MYWLFDPWDISIEEDMEESENFAGLLNRKRAKSIKLESGKITTKAPRSSHNNPRKEK